MRRMIFAAIFARVMTAALPLFAQDTEVVFAPLEDESAGYQVETVFEGLDNPGGLAVRTGSAKAGPHELFIAESGAGRVIRITTHRPQEINEAIDGFSSSSFGKGPSYRVGPLGLAFLTRSKLIVAGGSQEPEKGTLRVFVLPEDGSAISADQFDHAVGPVKTGGRSALGEAIFFGMAKTEKALFVTWAEETHGWVLKAGIEANRLAFLQPYIATQKLTGLGNPAGIAVNPSPRPPFLVVAQMGRFETPRNSLLSFYVPSTGALAMSLGTGLHDIIGLAYSPTRQLYALDFAWPEEASGGVYRLDDARVEGRQACRAVKIATVIRPTALAFTPDGSLYVTAFGTGENTKQGVLLKITGDL